jgi:hypothetical protein
MNMRAHVGIKVTGLILGLFSLAGCGSSDDAAVAQGVATDVSGVTQNWDKVLPAAQRFVVLSAFNNEAVRDNETGLVWEKSPATTFAAWSSARFRCTTLIVGVRKGWRLPSVHELASLVDPSVPAPGPALAPGHPFLNVQAEHYWSSTADATDPTLAWRASFLVGGAANTSIKTQTFLVWCVRGPMNADQY